MLLDAEQAAGALLSADGTSTLIPACRPMLANPHTQTHPELHPHLRALAAAAHARRLHSSGGGGSLNSPPAVLAQRHTLLGAAARNGTEVGFTSGMFSAVEAQPLPGWWQGEKNAEMWFCV